MDFEKIQNHIYYGQPRGCAASAAIFLLIFAIFATSCKHIEYVSVPELHTDTLYISKTQHDSVHVRDSIYLHEYTKGDTVFVEKVSWQTEWKEFVRIDTIYKSRIDSVNVPYPVEIVKTKTDYSGWWAFVALLAATAVASIVIVRRYK